MICHVHFVIIIISAIYLDLLRCFHILKNETLIVLSLDAFMEFLYGKFVGEKRCIGKEHFHLLFVAGILLNTKLKSNMKGSLMTMSDRLLIGRGVISISSSSHSYFVCKVSHFYERTINISLYLLFGHTISFHFSFFHSSFY